jgi:hypothetical protein
MRIKYKGEWYEIRFIRVDGMKFDIDPIYCDHEQYIEDIEINGRHLAHLNDEVSKSETAKQQNDKSTEKVGKEENFLAKDGTKTQVKVYQDVKFLCDGSIRRGNVEKVYQNTCDILSEGTMMYNIDKKYIVDDSVDANPLRQERELLKLQAEYWQEKSHSDIPDLIPPAPDIDWEQRTWEAFLKMYNPNDSYEADSTLEKAKSVVNAYREKTQL